MGGIIADECGQETADELSGLGQQLRPLLLRPDVMLANVGIIHCVPCTETESWGLICCNFDIYERISIIFRIYFLPMNEQSKLILFFKVALLMFLQN